MSTVLWLDSLPPLGGTPFSGIFPSQHSPDLDFPQSPPPPAPPQNIHIWLSDVHSWHFSWNFLVKMWINYSGRGTCRNCYYHKRTNASWIFYTKKRMGRPWVSMNRESFSFKELKVLHGVLIITVHMVSFPPSLYTGYAQKCSMPTEVWVMLRLKKKTKPQNLITRNRFLYYRHSL